MKNLFLLVKYDFLQRVRSYGFLITLCLSLAIAYSFVPAASAQYSTVQIGSYIGYYNSAWIAYVIAIMTSLFLSLSGFFLVNGTIKNDFELKIGDLIATSSISSFTYLLAKAICNFFILFTIVIVVFVMSIVLFFLYQDVFAFEIIHFIKAYGFVCIPSLFIIAIISLILEILLPKYSMIQRLVFFILFSQVLIIQLPSNMFLSDVLGINLIKNEMIESVKSLNLDNSVSFNIGFLFKAKLELKNFLFDGVIFPNFYLFQRLIWMLIMLGLLFISSLFFHRFKLKKKYKQNKKTADIISEKKQSIQLENLTRLAKLNSILPLIKIEFVILLRQSSIWINLLTLAIMCGLCFAPIVLAHSFILPLLWFVNVPKWSSIINNENQFGLNQITSCSFRPLSRILFSQFISGVLLAVLISLPLLVRYILVFNFIAFLSIILGAFILILIAIFLALISKSKKLFEVLFFIISYANLNLIAFVDYFGALNHSWNYILVLIFVVLSLLFFVLFLKLYQLRSD